jgi:P pilus assembly chaperone PapD
MNVFRNIRINNTLSALFFQAFAGLLLAIAPLAAQGDLLIFPKRIVFEGGKKSDIINLTNIGKDTATYKISFIQIRMNENGSFENITQPDSGQFFAEPLLRYYPRSVTLGPNESQVVKLQLKSVGGMPDGEYRSHLYFRADKTAGPQKDVKADTSNVSVHISALFGISIATIIRAGKSTARVGLSNLWLERNEQNVPLLHMEFHRSGNMSVYGNLNVQHISPEGVATKVGEVSGLAVYTPGTLRRAALKLQEPPGVDYSKGKLVLVYATPPEAKNVQLATAELALPANNTIH